MQRHHIAFLILCTAVSAPILVQAESITAGLPQSSVWFGTTNPIGGATVTLFTPVYNTSDQKIQGDVVFTLDDTPIGTAPFELKAGESKLVSLKWVAHSGSHTLSATIKNVVQGDTKQPLTALDTTTEGVTVAIAEPPPKPVLIAALNDAVQVVTEVAAVATPIVVSTAQNVFETTETLRTDIVENLQKDLAETEADKKSEGVVLGAETYRDDSEANTASAISAPASIDFLRILKQGLLFIVSYVWLFYPLLILILLGGLFIIGKALNRRPQNA